VSATGLRTSSGVVLRPGLGCRLLVIRHRRVELNIPGKDRGFGAHLSERNLQEAPDICPAHHARVDPTVTILGVGSGRSHFDLTARVMDDDKVQVGRRQLDSVNILVVDVKALSQQRSPLLAHQRSQLDGHEIIESSALGDSTLIGTT
jgi:hypothetical protein